MQKKKKLQYIDLFAGCGGLSLGLFNSQLWHGVLAIEKNAMAFNTLRHNLIDKNNHFEWPKKIICAEHDIDELLLHSQDFLSSLKGKIDMVAGGPPCQGFSTAGKRQEDDVRNHLVHSYIKFVKIIQPKVIFFENVRGFTLEFQKNKDKGKNYSQEVINELNKDYKSCGHMVDFSDYGIPQTRKRYILVGIRKDIQEQYNIKPEDFFSLLKEKSPKILTKKNLKPFHNIQDAISDLEQSHGTIASLDGNKFMHGIYGKPTNNLQKYLKEDVSSTIPDSHRFARHSKDTENRFFQLIQAHQQKIDLHDDMLTKKRNQIVLSGNKPSPTLTTLPDDYIHYKEPRILTVREYARIQTFNDWYQITGKYTTGGKLRKKEVPRYTQIGNAIPPLFAEQAGIIMYELLNKK